MSVQILKTGVVNASGGVNPNLLRDTVMGVNNGFASNGSTDWTKYFRYYNGSTSIHTIVGDIDTILLNANSNLGVCFQRKATDISLDANSYYTLSCEAMCTKSSARLVLGTSYYTTANAWVWRGGVSTGYPVYFTAIGVWQRFSYTFKPDADTQYIDYGFTVVGATDGTDTFAVRHGKLEKGEIATAWIPNELDSVYVGNTVGFNDTMVQTAQIAQEYVNATDFIEI